MENWRFSKSKEIINIIRNRKEYVARSIMEICINGKTITYYDNPQKNLDYFFIKYNAQEIRISKEGMTFTFPWEDIENKFNTMEFLEEIKSLLQEDSYVFINGTKYRLIKEN